MRSFGILQSWKTSSLVTLALSGSGPAETGLAAAEGELAAAEGELAAAETAR